MEMLGQLKDWVLLLAQHGAEATHRSAAHATALAPQKIVTVSYLWLIPFFPLLGSALNAFLGSRIQRRFGKQYVSYIAVGAMVLSLLVALVALNQMLRLPVSDRYLVNFLWNMITAGDVQANLSFFLDPLSMMMTLIITLVGALIHIYSIGYMADDPAYWRFFCYLNLFVFSMLLLVMGDNFVLMFFGWEGVGLCSYLLIGFWYEDIEKARAGVKAFVTNRVGDFGFVLGLFLLFWALGGSWVEKKDVPARESRWAKADPSYQPKAESGLDYARDPELSPSKAAATWEQYLHQPGAAPSKEGMRVGPTFVFRELRDQIAVEDTGVRARLAGMNFFGIPLLALAGILLFVGATAKSAQIPLYVWLPDAMAGPTPVSALIHAATMVTAGVYMVARLSFLFALSTTAMTVIAVTGAATAMFAASIGFVQNDIKKVLAYSTVSQLGFMFIGVGVGAYWAGVYHLLTHAFFKACLFLGSGSVILGCHHEQDMRRMGGLKKFMPLTAKTYLYACIAIAGFPIANGFFSKDEILWKAFDSGSNLLDPAIGRLIWVVGWLTACGTSFYMWRSYYMTFTGEYRGAGGEAHHGAPLLQPAVVTGSFSAAAPAAVAHGASLDSPHAQDMTHPDSGPDPHSRGAAGHPDHPDHKAGGGHGHGGMPHESPKTMTYVLVTLAIGCFATIALGFWAPLGHLLHLEWMQEPMLERWLAPSFAPSRALVESRQAGSGTLFEWLLMIASVAVAFAGWLVARAFYKDAKSTVPQRLAAAFPGLYRLVHNKYYVDELYQATVLRGTGLLARALAVFDNVVIDGIVNGTAAVVAFVANIDGAIDKYLVDGAVNFFAEAMVRAGGRLRRLQTGRIQNYLYAAVLGALVVIGINFLIH